VIGPAGTGFAMARPIVDIIRRASITFE